MATGDAVSLAAVQPLCPDPADERRAHRGERHHLRVSPCHLSQLDRNRDDGGGRVAVRLGLRAAPVAVGDRRRAQPLWPPHLHGRAGGGSSIPAPPRINDAVGLEALVPEVQAVVRSRLQQTPISSQTGHNRLNLVIRNVATWVARSPGALRAARPEPHRYGYELARDNLVCYQR